MALTQPFKASPSCHTRCQVCASVWDSHTLQLCIVGVERQTGGCWREQRKHGCCRMSRWLLTFHTKNLTLVLFCRITWRLREPFCKAKSVFGCCKDWLRQLEWWSRGSAGWRWEKRCEKQWRSSSKQLGVHPLLGFIHWRTADKWDRTKSSDSPLYLIENRFGGWLGRHQCLKTC